MDEVVLTFLGQAGVGIRYRGTTLVTDPNLSYILEKIASEKTPWKRNYPPPCTLEELKPDGILISHSHADHLDRDTLEPYYRAGGQAPLALPAPEAGKALWCPRVLPSRAEQGFAIGDIEILPIACAHTQLHTDAQGRFRELSYFLRCGGVTVFFGGDLSLYDGLTERILREKPDVVILPVNGADEERTNAGIIGNIDEREAAEIAARAGAVLLPMHHDLYAINGCAPEAIRGAASITGARLMLLSVMQSAVLERN